MKKNHFFQKKISGEGMTEHKEADPLQKDAEALFHSSEFQRAHNVSDFETCLPQQNHNVSVIKALLNFGLSEKEINTYLHEHKDEISARYADAFYSVGELSQMIGVSKQLLIYYDTCGLFSPEIVAENGYRYYSLAQCHTAELIVNLRKMDVSLEAISNYLQNRTESKLIDLYQNCISKYNEQIRELRHKINTLDQKIRVLQNAGKVSLNRPEVITVPHDRLFLRHTIPLSCSLKQRYAISAKWRLDHLPGKEYLLEENILMVPLEALTKGLKSLSSYDILMEIKHDTTKSGRRHDAVYKIEKGSFLQVYIKSLVHMNTTEFHDVLAEFLRTRKLTFSGDILLFPYLDFHVKEENMLRIYRMLIPVTPV